MKTFDSPAGIQHGHTRPSGRRPDPGCRCRTRSPCRSTCLHGNAPRPRTGSFPWRRRIHHSTDRHASLWCDPARKAACVCLVSMYNADDRNEGLQKLSRETRQSKSKELIKMLVCVCALQQREDKRMKCVLHY